MLRRLTALSPMSTACDARHGVSRTRCHAAAGPTIGPLNALAASSGALWHVGGGIQRLQHAGHRAQGHARAHCRSCMGRPSTSSCRPRGGAEIHHASGRLLGIACVEVKPGALVPTRAALACAASAGWWIIEPQPCAGCSADGVACAEARDTCGTVGQAATDAGRAAVRVCKGQVRAQPAITTAGCMAMARCVCSATTAAAHGREADVRAEAVADALVERKPEGRWAELCHTPCLTVAVTVFMAAAEAVCRRASTGAVAAAAATTSAQGFQEPLLLETASQAFLRTAQEHGPGLQAAHRRRHAAAAAERAVLSGL